MNLLKRINSWKQSPKYAKFQRNIAPKILSILFAVVFWLYVMDQVNPEMVKTIPDVKVEMLNLESVQNEGMVIMGDKEFYVDVKLKGRRSEVIKVTANDLLITADLEGFQKGTNNIMLNSKIFVSNVAIESLSMNSIKISLDRIVEVAKSVKIEYVGTLAENYTTGDLSVTPQEITVKGPESLVNNISSIRGQLDLTEVSNQLAKEIPVTPVDLDGNVVNGVELGKNYVTVQIGIYKLSNIPVGILTSNEVAEGYKLVKMEVLPAVITIRGNEEIVSNVESIMTEEINLMDLTETTELEVALSLPEGISVPFAEQTATVKIYVEPLMMGTLEYNSAEIAIENMNPELNYEVLTPESTLFIAYVQDSQSVVSELEKGDMKLSVDVGTLEEGDRRLELKYFSETPYTSVRLSPETLLIRITRR
ncbi:CdaR family protein [Acidaminobacter hydrogenoformans]|uniref:YbbR domain-containing protein n=1 Tax=Acidaminobacter hydrogenoformans DSM 2784 TaxID=1120920 RepID=A0A1G5S5P5_9FIRM|nr:CdaR family protein [Acidaminobacter hydrogenoformans]SCZ81664.1 YbbR domain-containing protein [Acidaminobacter hydrogenoformans DSM 2784]